MKRFAILIGILLVELSAAVEITVTNKCSFPIWIETDGKPKLPGGTPRLNPNANVSFPIPSGGWISGRLVPKICCDQSGQNCQWGQSVPPCPSGVCQPPADTKIECTFDDAKAWCDISLVDGYSLPASIVPRGQQEGNCVAVDCNIKLSDCPQNENDDLGDLRVFEKGYVAACFSPCKKWSYPPPYGYGRSDKKGLGLDMCCPNPYVTPKQCNAGLVVGTQYVNLVRRKCPLVYSFAFDDEIGTHACKRSTSFDVTFCPSGTPSGQQYLPCTK